MPSLLVSLKVTNFLETQKLLFVLCDSYHAQPVKYCRKPTVGNDGPAQNGILFVGTFL